jgi:DNA-binding FadR family transcriptional regulator
MDQTASKWSLQPLRRPKLYVAIAERIEEMLVSGKLQPGEALPSERELMDLFRVGRSSVREALMWLNSMGLIEMSSGEKARVAAPSFDPLLSGMTGVARYFLTQPGGVSHLQDARTAFETGIVRQAAMRVTDEQVARVEGVLNANLAIAVDDFEAGERTDYAFHYELAAIPGNPIYASLFDAVAGWLREQRTTSMRIPEAVIAAKAAHRRIFNAVAKRDPDAACQAMEAHLMEVAAFHRQAVTQLQTRKLPSKRPRGKSAAFAR